MLNKNGLLIHFTGSHRKAVWKLLEFHVAAQTGTTAQEAGRTFTPGQHWAATLALLMTVLGQIGPFVWDPQDRSEPDCVPEYRVLPFDSVFVGDKLEPDPRKRVSTTHLTAVLQCGG